MGELEPDAGTFKWGVSTSQSYFPQDNSAYFTDTEDSIIRWLEQYSKDTTDTYQRGFLGKMLFSGEDVYKPVQVLSGGEKALVAISLYFAIMRVNPPSFCMLDELEAALDDVNVVRFANYLRRMNQKTQFIVITHRRGTMEEADMLYGVTMQDQGISKLLALHAHEAQEKLGITT